MSTAEDFSRWAFGRLAARDLSRAEEIWGEDAVDHFLPVGDAIGRAGIVAFFEEMFAAFPDFHIEPEQVHATAAGSVVQWRITGTFTGQPFQGVRPTGRAVSIRGCDVVDIRDGLVHINTVYWDGADFARQIGMLPRQGSLLDRVMLRTFNALTWLRTTPGVVRARWQA